jgi:hypothetical protein
MNIINLLMIIHFSVTPRRFMSFMNMCSFIFYMN